jgi:iron complex outermembrane receptor protein
VLLNAGAGNARTAGSARYGESWGADGSYRVYARGFERDKTERANGTEVRDGWTRGRRASAPTGTAGDRNATVQGDLYRARPRAGRAGKDEDRRCQPCRPVESTAFRRVGDTRSDLFRPHAADQPGRFQGELDILDLEFQYAVRQMGAHRLLWGAGYRHASDRVQNRAWDSPFLPADKS